MHGGDDDGLRRDQAGFGEQGELDVGITGALADARAVAVDGDAAEDDQVQWAEGIDLDGGGDGGGGAGACGLEGRDGEGGRIE
ncbi:hypothetical protein ADL09_15110 [Streptomyces sp. NRRL F-7442]|nr:hypothetical protein ADL09_15110 [Streptomyces sp. NRRL F-7442]